jgi:ABC-type lipoprotein release transport system permease subunit
MICEGVFLGIIGAAFSISISWLLTWCAQFPLRAYVEGQIGGEMPGQLFQFSWPAAAGVLVVAIAICSMASLLPAWRAARLDPVVAMRRT